jgi:hypothetical protein
MEKEKLLKEWAELQKEPKPVPRTNEFIKRHATAEIRILEELLAAGCTRIESGGLDVRFPLEDRRQLLRDVCGRL